MAGFGVTTEDLAWCLLVSAYLTHIAMTIATGEPTLVVIDIAAMALGTTWALIQGRRREDELIVGYIPEIKSATPAQSWREAA